MAKVPETLGRLDTGHLARVWRTRLSYSTKSRDPRDGLSWFFIAIPS